MANKINTVIYTGVTSGLQKRVYEHKQKIIEGFTKKYNVNKLVYYEVFDDIENAIIREKQIKAGSRDKKVKLIRSMNPAFRDLYNELSGLLRAKALATFGIASGTSCPRNDKEIKLHLTSDF